MTLSATDKVLGIGLDPVVAQQVYRAMLQAFSRPGLPQTFPSTDFPPALLPALALADLETGVAVLEDGSDWLKVLTVATGAPVAVLGEAKYITALRPPTADELLSAARGTALSPESASTVICSVPSLEGGAPVELTGPGVNGTETIAPLGFDATLRDARSVAVADFPAGIDILLVADDGTVLGLSRTTRTSTPSSRTAQEN
ncbi:phosphonate C-P lyase system protein PhnH [Rhodococcus sp. HNM0563]|uniref:phosphonate C-P lyase system protein PhnH n=1 Tax=unclassified Rhodococcus (in: high G+C Gram-positive bacteria) TaxID=192944 RepID=UPI00146B250C|nr:phosphonate C-P lyase system protein PhnH [Rhodococcus sp. F64268]MCK0090591.1 phosphonate C-P lyase system protein PhnH [Rhodococcus sp. F64268]NLU61785.1 phosphonate C-P lyase system protein PhnH [Rhodococcus sp. HNM0563]